MKKIIYVYIGSQFLLIMLFVISVLAFAMSNDEVKQTSPVDITLVSDLYPPMRQNNLINERFGKVEHPFNAGATRWHNGIDISCYATEPVYASLKGIIVSSGWNGSYGNYVKIRHNNSTETAYAHLTTSYVSVGQVVTENDVIGTCGSTGWSSGNHLHFELIIDNNFVNAEPKFAYKRSFLCTPDW